MTEFFRWAGAYVARFVEDADTAFRIVNAAWERAQTDMRSP